MPRVVVAGAGPGGLAAAIALAGAGLDVTVVEAKPHVGGRMSAVGDGTYRLDTGPTMLQLPQVLEKLVARAGKRLSDYVELRKVEPNARLHFWDGTTLETSTDRDKMRAALAQLGPAQPANYDRWMAEHAAKYQVAWERFIAFRADSMARYYNPLRLLPALKFKPWRSLASDLESSFHDERITYALAYPSKYLGLHPTTCSSVFSVIPYLELAFGVWHPMGGFAALAEGLARCFTDLGGTLRLSSPIAKVLVNKGKTTGVVLEGGERVEADAVVINADLARALLKHVDEKDRPTWTDRRIEKLKYSCSTFMVYLGLDRPLELGHHEIYLSKSVTDTSRDRLEDRTLDEDDPPFYVAHPSATDPSFAPKGHAALSILIPAPNTAHPIGWREKAEKMADRAIDRLSLVGAPDVRKHVRFKRVFTAETWRDDFLVHRGAVFNLAHGWTQLGPMRPRAASEDIDGLYFVGGGTHPGSGLVTIFESANICRELVGERFGLARPASDRLPVLPPMRVSA